MGISDPSIKAAWRRHVPKLRMRSGATLDHTPSGG
jgi:hypothetical protein